MLKQRVFLHGFANSKQFLRKVCPQAWLPTTQVTMVVVREARVALVLAAELDVTVHVVLGFQACKIQELVQAFWRPVRRFQDYPSPLDSR